MVYKWEFSHPGLALGATVVVVANSTRTAWSLASKWIEDNGVKLVLSDLKLINRTEFKSPCVVYGWNGDY